MVPPPHEFSWISRLLFYQEIFLAGKGGGSAVCDQYRMELMALGDGELTGEERARLEEHLDHCIYCNEEYNDILRMNEATSEALALAVPIGNECRSTAFWDHYYQGVCRKLGTRASWTAWSLVSLLLVIAGTLMIFGCAGAPLASVAGSICLLLGGTLIILGYYCNNC